MKNFALKAAGCVFVALGVIGIFLPLLPTTPFLLLAAACFARSSPAFHHWLVEHRMLGVYVRDWQRERSVPLKAKLLAVAMMSGSFAWMAFATNAPAIALWMAGILMASVAVWLVSRPTSKH